MKLFSFLTATVFSAVVWAQVNGAGVGVAMSVRPQGTAQATAQGKWPHPVFPTPAKPYTILPTPECFPCPDIGPDPVPPPDRCWTIDWVCMDSWPYACIPIPVPVPCD